MEKCDRLNELAERINLLLTQQESFRKEITSLRAEIDALKKEGLQEYSNESAAMKAPVQEPPYQQVQEKKSVHPPLAKNSFTDLKENIEQLKENANLENFIGANLISKIGILILIIGIFIGSKYAIENDMVSPLTRITAGYVVGLLLVGVALNLKSNYQNFSAVVLSGGMATLYFITYTAYSFYFLIPQLAAFTLMVILTLLTVVAALQYNRQVIAHIGLVGAYAVPFLLSDGSGKVLVFFSYVLLINIGILFTAFRKYWKKLYYVSFGFSWVIFLSWYVMKYYAQDNSTLALIFSSLFFVTFYFTFLISLSGRRNIIKVM